MVVITHRVSTAACCDRVVRLGRDGVAEIEPAGESRRTAAPQWTGSLRANA